MASKWKVEGAMIDYSGDTWASWGNVIFFFLTFLFNVGVQPISNAVMVSGVQQNNWAIYINVSILPHTSLLSRLPHYIKQCSLCYIVCSCWLFILNIAVCRCQSQPPSLTLPLLPLNYESVNLFMFCKSVHLYDFFFYSVYKGCHTVFLPFCLTSLSMTILKSIHVAANGIISFFLTDE